MPDDLLYNIRHFLQYIRARGFHVNIHDKSHGIFDIGHPEQELTAVEDVLHPEDIELIQSNDGGRIEIIA
jgi:hypothetical protein